MEEVNIQNTSIQSLPNEILTLILQHNDCQDIVAFGATCKRFWQMVECNQLLWKSKLKCVIPSVMFDLEEKHCDGDWLMSIKAFFKLRKQIYSEISVMSSKYYWPFTMTEMYYARVALHYLVHTFLAVKWVKAHMRNELPPEIVVNFFLQWIDTVNLFPDTDVERSINDLVIKVKMLLSPQCASKSQDCTNAQVSERQVLYAVTQVIYHQRHMAVIAAANLDTLNIVKVLQSKCANKVVIGAIYQAVARRCGVHCDLIAFPNHLFLQWLDRSDTSGRSVYTIDLSTGELKPKRGCPFSRSPTSVYQYCPDLLRRYITESFCATMGALRNWSTRNAQHLTEFLDAGVHSIYSFFRGHVEDNAHLAAMDFPHDLTYVDDAYIKFVRECSYLDTLQSTQITEQTYDSGINREVKERASNVKYAVGMICYNTKFDHLGIILGWDLSCDTNSAARYLSMNRDIPILAENGLHQPFYYVVTVDYSKRYVAQENLIDIVNPTRLYHLEDIDVIAREFTHFDGYSYVPNDEKKAQYPDDAPIAALYCNRSQYRRRVIPTATIE